MSEIGNLRLRCLVAAAALVFCPTVSVHVAQGQSADTVPAIANASDVANKQPPTENRRPMLAVFPTRIVLSGRQRVQSVTVSNASDVPAEVSIRFAEMNMTADGNLAAVPDGSVPAHSAAALLRYSPRHLILPAHGSQLVRIMVDPAATPPANGELRSHLMFAPAAPPVLPMTSREGSGRTLSLEVNTIINLSIPVFIRAGNVTVNARLGEPTLDRAKRTAIVPVTREGNQSLYGDLVLRNAKTGEIIAGPTRVVIYGEIDKLDVPMPIPAAVKDTAFVRGAVLSLAFTPETLEDSNPSKPQKLEWAAP